MEDSFFAYTVPLFHCSLNNLPLNISYRLFSVKIQIEEFYCPEIMESSVLRYCRVAFAIITISCYFTCSPANACPLPDRNLLLDFKYQVQLQGPLTFDDMIKQAIRIETFIFKKGDLALQKDNKHGFSSEKTNSNLSIKTGML